MGEVLQIVNQHVSVKPSLRRSRVWLDPGHPKVVVPGIALTLMVDRCDTDARYSVRVVPNLIPTRRTPDQAEEFWTVVRAVRLDYWGYPDRVLIELVYMPVPTH